MIIECSGNFTTRNEILVEVETPSLEALIAQGSGDVEINDIEQPSLHVSLVGSGRIRIKGKVEHFSADLSGSGDIKAQGLKALVANLTLSGSGDIRAYAFRSVKARLSGSGEIDIAGNPEQRDCKISGSGDIDFD